MSVGRLAAATLIAGALDIGSAFALAAVSGGSPRAVLATVASGPFGEAVRQSPLAPWLGLLTHFSIMAVMVAFFWIVVTRFPGPVSRAGPVLAGTAYGLLLYLVMYWIVLPLRWPSIHPQPDLWQVAKAAFIHVTLVGLPIAFMLRPPGVLHAVPLQAGQ